MLRRSFLSMLGLAAARPGQLAFACRECGYEIPFCARYCSDCGAPQAVPTIAGPTAMEIGKEQEICLAVGEMTLQATGILSSWNISREAMEEYSIGGYRIFTPAISSDITIDFSHCRSRTVAERP